MSALHRSAADVERRADDLIHSERLGSDGRADDVDHGVNCAYFMEVYLVDGSGVNLRFCCSKSFKDGDGGLLGGITNSRFADDFANFGQPSAVRVRVLMGMTMRRGCRSLRGFVIMMMLVPMAMFVLVMMLLVVRMLVPVVGVRLRGRRILTLSCPVLFPRKGPLAIHPDVDLGC